MDWIAHNGSLICFFGATDHVDPMLPPPRHVLMLLHAGTDPCQFTLPILPRAIDWRLFVDTGADSPNDVYPHGDGPAAPKQVVLTHHSMMCFVSADE
jgi:glycogen operon protein